VLAAHPAVCHVSYPGLPSHPDHAVARRLLGELGFGGMVSFGLAGGDPALRTFLNTLRIPTLAVSLGDVGSLIWPFAGADLIRFSVGTEDLADLAADVSGALDAAGREA